MTNPPSFYRSGDESDDEFHARMQTHLVRVIGDFEPAVLPLSAIEYPGLFRVRALNSKGGLKKGADYHISHILHDGSVALIGVAGWHPMMSFVQLLHAKHVANVDTDGVLIEGDSNTPSQPSSGTTTTETSPPSSDTSAGTQAKARRSAQR